MKTFKRYLGLLTLLAIVCGGSVLIFAAMLPTDWFVSRDVEISSTPEVVYPLFADFRNWEKWSPWQQKDKSLQVKIPGRSAGVGAAQTWESAKDGTGRTE